MSLLDELKKSLLRTENRVYRCDLESPIEERFSNHLFKYLRANVEIIPQLDIETSNGQFRVDFALKSENRLIGIECDGEEYHDSEENKIRDEWRDILILSNSKISTIYRISGKDIYSNINDLIYYLGKSEKDLFSESIDRLINSVHQSRRSTRSYQMLDTEVISYYVESESGETFNNTIEIVKRNLDYPIDPLHIKYLFHAAINPGIKVQSLISSFENKYSIEELIEIYNQKFPESPINPND